MLKKIVRSQAHLNAKQLWEIFKNKLNQLIKDHVPHKVAKAKDSLPWINTKTKKLIRKRDKLYRKMKKTGNLDTKIKKNKTPHPKIIKTELLAIYRGHCHTKGN